MSVLFIIRAYYKKKPREKDYKWQKKNRYFIVRNVDMSPADGWGSVRAAEAGIHL